jgi:Ca-activated chloride channel family protein
MHLRERRVAFAAAGLALVLTAPLASQQQPSFRAGTDLVALSVTVNVGSTPRYMTGLNADDFAVYEDGVKQDITVFNNTNSPLAMTLLLDGSASMDTRLHTAQEAAIGFARTLRRQDLAEIIEFDTRTLIRQTFTNDIDLLERAIRRTSANGATGLFNAIYIALDSLRKLSKVSNEEQVRRKAIILVSDGEDNASAFTFEGPEGILELAKKSETAIYAVGLRQPETVKSKNFNQSDFVLRQLSQQTGGRAFFPSHINDLANVYSQISDELSNQYTLGYSSRNNRRDGTWRRVVVRVNKPEAVVRTKPGYQAPSR